MYMYIYRERERETYMPLMFLFCLFQTLQFFKIFSLKVLLLSRLKLFILTPFDLGSATTTAASIDLIILSTFRLIVVYAVSTRGLDCLWFKLLYYL
jgi:hypothetical protein